MNKNILETLPDKKYYEYAYHKFFTDGVTYDNWKPHDTWTYPDRDISRFGHIITNQLQHITDRKILDLACHLGYISLFCLHNKAKYVIGTNVRDKELEIADEICHLAGHSNYNFVKSDIYNLPELKNLCDSVDTVILAGTMYHVNNHMELIKTIYSSNAKTLILESKIHEKDTVNPTLIFKKEDSDDSENGWEHSKKIVFVGVPNKIWLQQALEYVGYDVVYNNQITYTKPDGNTTTRGILVGQKNNDI